MTWHYCVLRYPDGNMALHEVFFDGNGEPNSYNEDPVSFIVDADTGQDGIIASLRMALANAINRTVLDVTQLERQPAR